MSTQSRAMMLGVLILWVFAGPIGMAFDSCPAMGDMCDAPCGLTTATVSVAPSIVIVLTLVGAVVLDPAAHPAAVARSFELPPRASTLSA